MSASYLASLLMFTITGVFALVTIPMPCSHSVKYWMAAMVFINAVYFYYFAAHAEMDEKTREQLRNAPALEWWIRVLNQSLLFGLWFAMQFGFGWFALTIILLYVGYISWDICVWRHVSDHTLFWFDALGLLVTGVFLWNERQMASLPAAASAPLEAPFSAGLATMGYGVFFLLGIIIGFVRTGFNPFSTVYMARDKRR